MPKSARHENRGAQPPLTMNPARDWFASSCNATTALRDAVARVVRCQHPYALAPFTALRTDEGWRIAANMSPPPLLDPVGILHWQQDGDIVLIDPETGVATVAGDEGGWIVGDLPHANDVMLYSNGLAFARAWAAARLETIELHRRGNVPGLVLRDRLDHALPGLLLAGPLQGVCSWLPLLERDRVMVDDPGMVRPIANALLRAKRVPVVEAAAPLLRKAA